MKQEIKIYGDIAPFSYGQEDVFDLEKLNSQLEAVDKNELTELVVGINTFGGEVDSGFAMYNTLRRFATENNCTITTRQDNYCASIGTVILLAGDNRIGNAYSSPFIHEAWSFAVGDSNELKRVAVNLEETSNKIAKFYAEKTNLDFELAKELMVAETWIEPEKALEYGFYTELENIEIPQNSLHNRMAKRLSIEKQENTKTIINPKQNKMSEKKKSILAKIEELFAGSKNLMVYTDAQDVLDFYDLEDGAVVKVGDKANFNDAPANGEFKLADGKTTYVFENGVLNEIQEAEMEDEPNAELEALKKENADLKAEIEQLKSQNSAIDALQTENDSLKNTITGFKALASEFKAELNNEDKGAPQKTGAEDREEKIKNFKFKR